MGITITTSATFTCDRCAETVTGAQPPGSLRLSTDEQLWLCKGCATDFAAFMAGDPVKANTPAASDPAP